MMTLNNTVYATGEGTPLVLVHAFPVDHRMWDDLSLIHISEPTRP